MPSKHGKQIAVRMHALCRDGHLPDTQKLRTSHKPSYYRTDIGEYRIVHYIENNVLHIPLVGKRNDDDVYRKLFRKL
ncbi:type II toxin-antitoxin system RelE/ParE family toxin [Candidatus Peregrinibacteria bacterium]|nr:type II toxin-antitoxin system RelE/ParE family toxin [Candidatus Peregrinibacteria bacterium]